MLDVKSVTQRMDAVLDGLDGLVGACDARVREALEDLNAELEDVLLLLSELRPGDADWLEEWEDALEEVKALAEDYRTLAEDVPGLEALARRLEQIAGEAAESGEFL